jgi:hypothetical protein
MPSSELEAANTSAKNTVHVFPNSKVRGNNPTKLVPVAALLLPMQQLIVSLHKRYVTVRGMMMHAEGCKNKQAMAWRFLQVSDTLYAWISEVIQVAKWTDSVPVTGMALVNKLHSKCLSAVFQVVIVRVLWLVTLRCLQLFKSGTVSST